MEQRPQYRVRLFLSVDLVGSTAFKSASEGQNSNDLAPSPVWVTETRKFYSEFPRVFLKKYQDEVPAEGRYMPLCPKLWKTIGDEIVFCCKIVDLEHLAFSLNAFVQALIAYGVILDGSGGHLDVKGCGWLASFPSPNVTLAISGREGVYQDSDLLSEELEARADANPENFDFLGKHVDTGFRLSKFSEADRLIVSIELAYLLSGSTKPKLFHETFDYHGRECLKGILSGKPYPVFAIDTERNETRMDLRSAENALLGTPNITPVQVRSFLDFFVQENKIEVPLVQRSDAYFDERMLPKTYHDFCARWDRNVEENKKRIANETEAESSSAVDPTTDQMSPTVQKVLTDFLMGKLSMRSGINIVKISLDPGEKSDVPSE